MNSHKIFCMCLNSHHLENLKKLENQDLLKFGMIPEFIGRLPVITTLDELDEDMLIKIMTQPKNAIIKQFEILMKMDNVKLEIKEDNNICLNGQSGYLIKKIIDKKLNEKINNVR